jgi:oligosaccharide repeat unit polymerase
VARIYSHKLDLPKPKSFLCLIHLIVVAVILSALVFVSFVSRLGEVQFGLSESIFEQLLFSIASYTLGQIYAFADFLSYTICNPSLTIFQYDHYSLGRFTFNSILSTLRLGRRFPAGVDDELSWYSNLYETNLVTVFCSLIYDFSVISSLIFVFLFGLFTNYIVYSLIIRNREWLPVVILISKYFFIFIGYLFNFFVTRYVFFTAAVMWLLLVINDRIYRLRDIP